VHRHRRGERPARVPIGRPIANTPIYILDAAGEPAPVGVTGARVIGGPQVARGYLGRPALTAASFVPDPFTAAAGARLYVTGDLARWRPDGALDFVGRADFQVKVRGFRIEVGEIEACLARHPTVGEVVGVARDEPAGDPRLVAYYTAADPASDGAAAADTLRAHAAAGVPEYMVPVAYVRLAALPQTPNGKLDRRALPAPDAAAYGCGAYEAPIGEIETTLAAIWAELLQVERVGRTDNFFALGGHSLLAIHVITRLQQQLDLEVPIGDLFDHPVLASLAEHILTGELAQFEAETPTPPDDRLTVS
jgi:acyl carrier protein